MDINITVSDPDDGHNTGPVQIGWFRSDGKNAVLFDPPERITQRSGNRSHAKSAARCPSVIQLESRYFMIKCPIDLHLGFARNDKGQAILINRAGNASPIRSAKLRSMVIMVDEVEWRYPDRPTVQMVLPYTFISDELAYVTQTAPFMHYLPQPWPGTIFGGRFPISVWPRPMMWAFEWHDTSKDLILRRGDPLFYVQFEARDPSRTVQLIEAELTPELSGYVEAISGAVNYVSQTFSLFKSAEAMRPRKLLKAKERE